MANYGSFQYFPIYAQRQNNWILEALRNQTLQISTKAQLPNPAVVKFH